MGFGSYKLVQFLIIYMDSEKVKITIVICSHTAQKWLFKLRYEYKDVYKDVVINRHEQPYIVEDQKTFLNKMEELKLYIVESDKNGAMKTQAYSSNCAVGGNYWQPIIVITHNKCTFSTNDKI